MHHWLRKALDTPMIQQDHGVALSRGSRDGRVPVSHPGRRPRPGLSGRSLPVTAHVRAVMSFLSLVRGAAYDGAIVGLSPSRSLRARWADPTCCARAGPTGGCSHRSVGHQQLHCGLKDRRHSDHRGVSEKLRPAHRQRERGREAVTSPGHA